MKKKIKNIEYYSGGNPRKIRKRKKPREINLLQQQQMARKKKLFNCNFEEKNYEPIFLTTEIGDKIQIN